MAADKRPTIDDVAAHSGVGKATVSRVLNGGPNVRPAMRERVLASVAALNYRVNVQARSLAAGRGRHLSLVHPASLEAEPNSFYHSGLELGALRGCAAHSFTLSVVALETESASPEATAQTLLDLQQSGRADGFILVPPFADQTQLIQELVASECPIVCISGGDEVRCLATSVGIDDELAGHDVGAYLVRLGHRRFGYIDGPEAHISAGYRRNGFMRALHAIDEPVEIVVRRGDFTFRSGVVLAEHVLLDNPQLTALVCANDDMAAGALLTAHRLGLSVPNDVSIVGFDDTPVSAIVWPPLTTIHQPLRRIGQRAAELLVAQLSAHKSKPHFEHVLHRLVERSSTGPPKM